MELRVHSLSGQVFVLKIEWSDDVDWVKFEIERLSGIPMREQRLVFGTRILNNNEQPWQMLYNVKNVELKSSAPGIAFRSSMQLNDKASEGPPGAPDHVARWGCSVHGVQVAKKWLQVGQFFLPMQVRGKPVIFQAPGQVTFGKNGLADISLIRIDPEKALALEKAQEGGEAYYNLPEHLRRDREVALAAVRVDGYLINASTNPDGSSRYQCVPEDLRNDSEIVLTALHKGSGWLFQYASEDLRGNRDVVLAAVRIHPSTLEWAAEHLKGNHEIVLAAVQKAPWALQYAAEELKHNREIVLVGVQLWSYDIFPYAGEEFKSDREIILCAVGKDGKALQYASEYLQSDKDVVLAAVRNDIFGNYEGGHGKALAFAGENVRADADVVLAAIHSDCSDTECEIDEFVSALDFASPRLRNSHRFWRRAVKRNAAAFHRRPRKFRRDGRLIFQYHTKKMRQRTHYDRVLANSSSTFEI